MHHHDIIKHHHHSSSSVSHRSSSSSSLSTIIHYLYTGKMIVVYLATPEVDWEVDELTVLLDQILNGVGLQEIVGLFLQEQAGVIKEEYDTRLLKVIWSVGKGPEIFRENSHLFDFHLNAYNVCIVT